MTYQILATGSTGNAVILNSCILLDCGVSWKLIEPYAQGLKLVFISHTHSDHFRDSTVRKLAKARPALRFCGGRFLVRKYLDAGVSARNIDVLDAERRYDYGILSLEPVPLLHDVPNFGLKLQMGGESAFFAVDTASLSHVSARGFDLYLVEGNYSESELQERLASKLEAGQFAYEQRVAHSHLSREQAEAWLSENMGPQSQAVFLHQHKGMG